MYGYSKKTTHVACRRCSKGEKLLRKRSYNLRKGFCVSCHYGKSSRRKPVVKSRKFETRSLRMKRPIIRYSKWQKVV